ncbi:DUF4292 domain-containing protein [Puia sp.]|jgi:hypothetical protein|uniref:DUF4292 domain-containing protein n=1 Tax=Puia sp. TaxID=2045100 RepID=UPI002F42E71E
MQKFIAALVLGLVVIGFMGGCRGTKKIQKAIATTAIPRDTTGDAARAAARASKPHDAHADSMEVIRQSLVGLVHNTIDFQTFSGHMHVHYEGADGKGSEFNAVVRIKKDSMIWVSINAFAGIEAFRLLITPDSVKILDKLKKIARLRSVTYLQEQIHLPIDFITLQDLLIGNPIYVDTARILFYKEDNKGVTLFSAGTPFRNYLTLNPDYTLQHSKLDDVDPLRARTGDLTYGEYDHGGGMNFSTYRRISVAEKTKVDIEINVKQFKFNEPLSTSFQVPKNYKRR